MEVLPGTDIRYVSCSECALAEKLLLSFENQMYLVQTGQIEEFSEGCQDFLISSEKHSYHEILYCWVIFQAQFLTEYDKKIYNRNCF